MSGLNRSWFTHLPILAQIDMWRSGVDKADAVEEPNCDILVSPLSRQFDAMMNHPRLWILLASLATRGAGFLTSLLISRLVGVSALGVYSAMVNTASLVATPFAQVMANNATVLGAVGERSDPEVYREHARASFLLAFGLAGLSGVAFVLLYVFVLGGIATHSAVLVGVGLCVVAGQIIGSVSLGFLYGAGEFMLASRISFLVALIACPLSYPIISSYGLGGGLALLLLITLVPPVLMATKVLVHTLGKAENQGGYRRVAIVAVRSHFRRALSTIATITINSGTNWFLTIYLVQAFYGAAGVGVFAVAGQWLNLMLIPTTSWGGVAVKSLSDAVATGDSKIMWHVAFGLMRKNLIVTLALTCAISMAAGFIARAYGLVDTEVVALIWINAGCALIGAVNNIFERFLLVLDRQTWWLAFSLISFVVQACFTVLLISSGLWVVAAGVFLAGLTSSLLNYIGVRRALRVRMSDQA
jgi:O-antigen/teichoic acid export membrane protein